jgi:hypothetical protein
MLELLGFMILAIGRTFTIDDDSTAMVKILSRFRRLDYIARGLNLRSNNGDSNHTKSLNRMLQYLVQVNHSGTRVFIPDANDAVLAKVGVRFSTAPVTSTVGDRSDKAVPEASKPTLPISLWPKVLELAWKKSKTFTRT